MERCPYCNTSYEEIMQTGFVGCEKCYIEIQSLQTVVANLYNGKKHKGKFISKGGDYGSF